MAFHHTMREWRLWLKDWAGLVEENTDTMVGMLVYEAHYAYW